MSNLGDLFDSYTRKARLYPVLLVTMPAGCSVVLLWPGLGLEKLTPIIVAAGLPFFVTSLIRSAGKRLENRLVAEVWDGLPTTRMLRLRDNDNNPELRRRYREKLTAITETPLPTEAEELADPRRADQHYVAATRVLIAKVRDDKDNHPRVHGENTEYGFRRNLLAAKPLALALLVVLLAADGLALALGQAPQSVGVAAAVHLLAITAWVLAVREPWVHEQAATYAERLFEALDQIETTSTPPPST